MTKIFKKMIKIYLSLLVTLAIAEALKIDFTRIYFYVNLNETENSFFKDDGLGPSGTFNGSNDLTITWKRPLNQNNVKDFRVYFTVDYNRKQETVKKSFNPCKPYPENAIKNLGQSFFYRIIAGSQKRNKCLLGKNPTKGSGHLQFESNLTNGITCGIPVLVRVEIVNFITTLNTEKGSSNNGLSTKAYDIFKAIYMGQFSDC